MRRKPRRGGDDDDDLLIKQIIDDQWAEPIAIIGLLCFGAFILSIIVWTVFQYSEIKISNIGISLLIAIPTTILLNELLVGNALWRTDDNGKTLRLTSIPMTLFSPLNIFGQKGFNVLFLWLPPHWPENVFIIWWATFLILTYIRK